ncbi:MAG: isoamylase early set domain-containing protein [Gemmatimonadales bacterium]
MTEPEDPLAPFVARLREPADLSPDFTARVMAEIDRTTPREAPPPGIRWWQRRWTFEIGPLGGLAAAAGLAAIAFLGHWSGRSVVPPVPAPAPALAAAPAAIRTAQFVLVAPEAASVTLIGDFNDWSPAATPLVKSTGADGVWSVTIPLDPGRYRYAFMVDGDVWRPDPEAQASEDEFGRPSSVVTIGGA